VLHGGDGNILTICGSTVTAPPYVWARPYGIVDGQ
jgi:hypothetical protein